MRAAQRIAVGVLVLAITGCLQTASVSVRTKTTPTVKPTTIKAWPVAQDLTGPIPVGRWACIADGDLERLRKTNSGNLPRLCSVVPGTSERAVEFRPDGSGWTLDQYGGG